MVTFYGNLPRTPPSSEALTVKGGIRYFCSFESNLQIIYFGGSLGIFFISFYNIMCLVI